MARDISGARRGVKEMGGTSDWKRNNTRGMDNSRQQLSMPNTQDRHRVFINLINHHVGKDRHQFTGALDTSWTPSIRQGRQTVAKGKERDRKFPCRQRIDVGEIPNVALHIPNRRIGPKNLHRRGAVAALPCATSSNQSRTRSCGMTSPRSTAARASATAARSRTVSGSSSSLLSRTGCVMPPSSHRMPTLSSEWLWRAIARRLSLPLPVRRVELGAGGADGGVAVLRPDRQRLQLAEKGFAQGG